MIIWQSALENSIRCAAFSIPSPLQQKMKENVQNQQDSGAIGPLDDAFADLAGVPRKPKPTNWLPKREPVEFNFDQGFESYSSDDY